MSRSRLLALAAALTAFVTGPRGLASSASAQDVYVVPADGSYAAYGEPSAPPRYAGLAPFLEALSPYGTWVDLPSVGLAWKPDDSRVGVTFVPYVTNGHWGYSEVGWVFESDFEWGYATFHYGRWLFDGQLGWVWAPDTEWGASWVDWRVADGYVGWAPLPPAGYAYSVGYGPSYTFVSVTYLTYADLGTYILPAPATAYWAERSTPCTTVWSGAGRTWPAGPRVAVPSRGVVRVNPPTRGVVQVRPAAFAPGAASSGSVSVRAGGFVDPGPGARVGISGPRSSPGAAVWGNASAQPASSASPVPGARSRYGVQRTVLPPRYDVPPPPSTPPVFAQPAQPQRPAFAQPPLYAQPAQPQRPTFARPVEPQRPTFAQPPRQPFVQQPPPPPTPRPLPQAPVVARPPPQVVVPPSAAVRGAGVRVR